MYLMVKQSSERVTRPSSTACEAWRLVSELFVALRERIPALAVELDLSPQQCHVLRSIEPGSKVPMRRLAETLGCDASNVTGIIDRLEARGFVARRTAAHDRRVKVLAITARGATARARIIARMAIPADAIAHLSEADLDLLCRLLRRALGHDASTD